MFSNFHMEVVWAGNLGWEAGNVLCVICLDKECPLLSCFDPPAMGTETPRVYLRPCSPLSPILHSQAKQKTNGNNKFWFSTPWNFRYLLSFSWLGCRKENREEKKNDENNVWHLSSSSRKTIEMIRGRLVDGNGVKGWHSRNATLCQHFHFPKVTSLYTTFRLSNFFHSESHIYTGDALREKLPQVC